MPGAPKRWMAWFSALMQKSACSVVELRRARTVRTVAPVGPRKPPRGSMATARSAILACRSRTASASTPAATPCRPAQRCQPRPPAAPAFMEGSASDRLRRPRPAPAPRKHFRRRSLAIGFAGHGQLRHRPLTRQRLMRHPIRWENPPPDHVLTRLTLEPRVGVPSVSTCRFSSFLATCRLQIVASVSARISGSSSHAVGFVHQSLAWVQVQRPQRQAVHPLYRGAWLFYKVAMVYRFVIIARIIVPAF